MKDLAALVESDRAHLEHIRRDLHAHPELGYEEHRTASVVRRELESAGVQVVSGLAGETGVLGYLPSTGEEAAPTVALRADMDALPIEELTGLDYASRHAGKMHACGHDGHTTILIGAARALAQTERPNHVLFVFQPAEEGGAGGKRMCEDGVLEGRVLGRPADRIFGLHCYPGLQVGEVSSRAGTMMANADNLRIRVFGKGGHAAMPHTGIDPIVVASHLIVAMQSIVSRAVSPLDSLVITFGQVQAGTAHNIIPERADLVGTVRTLTAEARALAERRINEVANGVAAAFGTRIEVDYEYGYPAVVNDADLVDVFKASVGERVMADPIPVMGGEDFSFYGQQVPACFYWLGLMAPGQTSYPNLHAPEFDFNDAALPVGVRAMCRLATAPVA